MLSSQVQGVGEVCMEGGLSASAYKMLKTVLRPVRHGV